MSASTVRKQNIFLSPLCIFAIFRGIFEIIRGIQIFLFICSKIFHENSDDDLRNSGWETPVDCEVWKHHGGEGSMSLRNVMREWVRQNTTVFLSYLLD